MSILRAKCYECHAADPNLNPLGKGKVKGKLDMTTLEGLKKGGEEYSAVVAGDVGDSLMIERIRLPIDEDEHMPPEQKPQIEPHELDILEWWIESGLPEGKTLEEAGAPAAILAAVERLEAWKGTHATPEVAAPAGEPGPAEATQPGTVGEPDGAERAGRVLDETVAALQKEFPNALQPISQEDPGLAFTAVGMRAEFSDAHLAQLAAVGSGLVELNLASTSVTDAGLAPLKDMVRLRKLWLNETAVTDEGLAVLGGLAKLEYLNLFGTKVTDAGLEKLEGLAGLRSLYLWRTEVSPEGAAKFRANRPDCDVNLGVGE